MESNQSRRVLKLALILALLGQGANEMMRDLEMCGNWRHGKSGNLWFDLSRGCGDITVAANETTLSIRGKITGNCENSSTIPLTLGEEESRFCVYWEPLLDLLLVEVGGRNHTLCKTAALLKSCCTSLSLKANTNASGTFGILGGKMKGDLIKAELQESFTFYGEVEDCQKDLCDEDSPQLIEQLALRSGVIGQVDLPCAQVSTKQLEEGFQGLEVNFTLSRNWPWVSVSLPPSLVSSEKRGVTVVFTYYAENTLFQGPEGRILNQVVGISMENRVIANLPDPVKIIFSHEPVAKNELTKCVFWDAKKDPANVNWRDEGCNTIRRKEETECHCNHLTEFTVLVANPPSPVDLGTVMYITSGCCLISLFSCGVLIFFLRIKERRRENVDETDKKLIDIHCSLLSVLCLLYFLFAINGFLANMMIEVWCQLAGAALHWTLLCSYTFMAIEVFIAFRQVKQMNGDLPCLCVLIIPGFALPFFLVLVFGCINDVYGTRVITSSNNDTSPYKMCWIKDSNRGTVIHFFTNVGFAVAVVFVGQLSLFLVAWSQTQGQMRVTFFNIWWFSWQFGFTWSLGLLQFAPLSLGAMFFFCIISSLQGVFLLVLYFGVRWIGDQQPPAERGGDRQLQPQAGRDGDREPQPPAEGGGDIELQPLEKRGGDGELQPPAEGGGDGEQQPLAEGGGDRELQPPAEGGGDGEQQPLAEGGGDRELQPPAEGGGDREQQPPPEGGGDREPQPLAKRGGDIELQPPAEGGGDREQQPLAEGGGDRELQPPPEGGGDGEQQPPAEGGGDIEQQPPAKRGGDGELQPPAEGGGDGEQQPPAEGGGDGEQQPPAEGGGDGELQPPAEGGGDGEQQPPAEGGGDRELQPLAEGGGDRELQPLAEGGGDGELQPLAEGGGDREMQPPAEGGGDGELQPPVKWRGDRVLQPPAERGGDGQLQPLAERDGDRELQPEEEPEEGAESKPLLHQPEFQR